MKSTKFLAILAGTAMFAACSQEELVENNSTPQQMEEVVGAKLVGTDISLNAYVNGNSAQSRWAGGAQKWDESDVVGLGWVLSKGTAVDGDQFATVAPESSKLYANHMYNYESENGTWTTKGNLYEGWHFAYYPWSYERKAGQNKFYELNPAVKSGEAALHVSQSLHLSNRQFISEADVDKENGLLTKSFGLYQAVKFIKFTTQAAENSAFVKGGDLANLPIDSITINVGKNIFTERAVIAAANLPEKVEYSEDKSNEEINALNLANFCEAYPKVVKVATGEATVSEIGRNLEAAELKASTDGSWYVNVLPATADLSIDDITVTIHTTSASFIISKNSKYGLSETNQEALETLIAAYATDGALTKLYNEDGKNETLRLTLELRPEDFVTDFTQIKNYKDWEDAVEMVDILGRESENFEIIGQIDFAEGILMPKNGCKLTVDRGNDKDVDDNKESSSATLANYFFNITGNMTGWPENLTSNTIKVQIAEGVTVDDAHLISARQIVNYGTMNVPAEKTLTVNLVGAAKIKNEGEINLGYKSKVSNIDNATGRINVIYGSYVELYSGTEAGEIAYIVDEDDAAEPQRIKDVIAVTGSSTENRQYANVNILVFNKENVAEFDFTKSTSGKPSDNPYYDNSTDGSEEVLVLNDVNLEINGVEVSSSSTEKTVTVKDVTINGGAIKNIAVAGNLTVKGGNVVANVANIAEALTIEAGQGEITANTIKSVDIKSGAFTINAETIEGDVTATGENYFNVETIKGNVVLTNNSATVTHIEGATIERDVTLYGNFDLRGVTIKGNLTINKGTVKASDLTINNTLSINKGVKVIVNSEEIISIREIVNDGGELISNNDIKVENITLQNKSVTTLGEDWENTVWYTGKYIHNNSSVNGYVKKCPSTPEELQSAFNNAVAGETIYLSEKVADYGTITIGELKNVTIEGAENSVVIFKTTASTKIENVTLQKVNFQYTGATADCGIVINADAEIENLVLENCTFTGTGAKAGRGLSGANNSASIVINNCTFKDMGYPIYAWGGYESLTIEDCTFENTQSWAIMPQSGFNGDLVVTGCHFKNCAGGLVKAGTLTAGHTFTFTNNTVTNSTEHPNRNWFEFTVSNGKTVINNNTMDGQPWTPSVAEGLK